MRLLLTSAGIKNATIHSALVELLGKSTEEASALCIPTGSYGHHNFAGAWRFINGKSPTPMVEMGWKSLGVLELTALPSLDRERWVPIVEETDVPAGKYDGRCRTMGRPAWRCRAYAIDDETAIQVVDGTVEVVSEGHWKLFTPSPRNKRIGLGDNARSPRSETDSHERVRECPLSAAAKLRTLIRSLWGSSPLRGPLPPIWRSQ